MNVVIRAKMVVTMNVARAAMTVFVEDIITGIAQDITMYAVWGTQILQ